MPKLITYFNQTPIFELYTVLCGSKNGYQKDMCLKEIGFCAQSMITILCSINSIINIIGRSYMTI